MKKNILLVSASFDDPISKWIDSSIKQGALRKAFAVPLGIATIAALTPENHDVTLWDEAVQGHITDQTSFDKEFDLVGISAYSFCGKMPHAKELARMFQRRGSLVVIGGPGVTAEPHLCRGHFDVLFIGEAEETWPQFLSDWEAGRFAAEYVPTRLPDLTLSPKPRWDSIADLLPTCYKYGAVQINRGCPHECEFCAMWSQFGRKVRSKTTAQVLEEVRELARLGLRGISVSTDNLYGSPTHARELVRELAALNRTLESPLGYLSELSLNASRDHEFLCDLADAGFGGVFIGVESSSVQSLKETRKRQNIQGDLVSQCLKIASYGVFVQAGLIVGFDSDTEEIFEQHFRFLQDACIPCPRLNVLYAAQGTDLRKRLIRDGRVLDTYATFSGLAPTVEQYAFSSNIAHTCMSRSRLYEGMLKLTEKVWDWHNFEARLCGFIDNVKRLPDRKPTASSKRTVETLRAALPKAAGANPEVIDRVFQYSEQKTPLLTPAVGVQLLLMCWEVSRLDEMMAAIRKQIEIERDVEARNAYVFLPRDPEPIALVHGIPAAAVN